jgi:hypothetical protein
MYLLKTKLKEGLTAEEAIENLSAISDIEIDKKQKIGILENKRIVSNDEELSYKDILFLYPEDPIGFIDKIKPSYITIFEYLKSLKEDQQQFPKIF